MDIEKLTIDILKNIPQDKKEQLLSLAKEKKKEIQEAKKKIKSELIFEFLFLPYKERNQFIKKGLKKYRYYKRYRKVL